MATEATRSVVHELGTIMVALDRVSASTDLVGRQVEVVSSQQAAMGDELAQFRQVFDEFMRKDAFAKALQLARTEIIEVRQSLDTEYGYHATVRRQTTGILQAIDAGIVTQEIIQAVSEEQMINAVGYWLAPAVVSLAAWIRDDKALADKAVAEALKRDSGKASLFYALVLRRFGRASAVASWLSQYLMRQDPDRLNREFIVVINATAGGAFGADSKAAVSQVTTRWLEEFAEEPDNQRKLRDRWKGSLINLIPDDGQPGFPTLYSVSSASTELAENLQMTAIHTTVDAWLDGVFDGELSLARNIETQIDELLNRLVTNFDVEELPLRRNEARLKAIIEAQGDESRADQSYQANVDAFEATTDFPTLLANAALTPDTAGGSRATQRMAVALSKPYLVDGYNLASSDYRANMVQSVPISIDTWKTSVPYEFTEAPLVNSLTAHCDSETKAAVARIKLGAKCFVLGILAGLALILAFTGPPATLIFLAVAGALGFWSYSEFSGLDKRRKAAEQLGEQNKVRRLATLRTALAELIDYRMTWAACDALEPGTQDRIAHINPADYSMSRPERREVVA